MVDEIPPHAERRLYLIDGSGFIFRAFHALPPMTRADGTPVNAVLGFTNMLLKLLTDFHAGQVAIIFDAARGNFATIFIRTTRPTAAKRRRN
jgi:DNA polymerase-1